MSELDGAETGEAAAPAVETESEQGLSPAQAPPASAEPAPAEGGAASADPQGETAAVAPTAPEISAAEGSGSDAGPSAEASDETSASEAPDASGAGTTRRSAAERSGAPELADPAARRIACLLSVRRSVAWASRQDKGAPHLKWIGAASLRLLAPFLSESSEADTQLLALARALEAIDDAPARSRRRLLGRVRRATDDLLGDAAPPRRSRSRRERPKATEAPVEAEPVPESARPDASEPAAEAVSAREESDSEATSGGRRERGSRKRRRGRRRGPAVDEAPAPEAVVEEAAPAVITRPLGHPLGTGRSVAELGILDEAELEALTHAGVHTLADLLQRAPTHHRRAPKVALTDAPLDEPVTLRGPIRWRVVRLSSHSKRWEVALGDEGAPPLRVRWFRGPPRGWDRWEPGQELGLYGEIREAEAGPTMYEAEPLGLAGRGSGLMPCYGIEGVDDARLRDVVAAALESIEGGLADWLPATIREQNRLLSLDEAFRDAHFPSNSTRRGRLRLAFDELFTIQVGVAWRSGRGKPPRGVAHKPVHTGIGQIEAQHQIQLNDVQELAFSEIRRDLVAPTPMSRLLQGDVGSGKGLVAQLSALMVAGGGCQVAMVSPDALAAERRFLHIDPILRSIGIKTLLVADDQLDRAQVDAIRRGEAQIVFGTRALLQKSVGWKRLGLVTIEERGPYGTVELDALSRRGARPDLLVIPRAPIPSSLAFTVFGDFDVSTLQAPPHRTVQCEVRPTTERVDAYATLRQTIEDGRQGYVVFPVRGGRDLLSVEDAVRTAKALRSDFLPGCRIGVYSSEMSREERSRIFDDFQQRRIDVLVCTTYIEDSPAVTNATAMVVEYADMHDLVRLHRLRAHVSGGYKPGTCAFVTSESPDPAVVERLDQLLSERDGFRLAELDLQLRGAGAILGDRATEAPRFTWADPPEDRGLLMRARAAAFELVRRDPELRSAGGVAATVNIRWGDWLGQALPKVSAKKRTDGRRRRRKRR